MTESRTALLTRKSDLLDALRALERDRSDGVIDQGAYQTARRRYELEAAAVLERLDRLDPEESAVAPSPPRLARMTGRRIGVAAGLGLVALALGILLFSALHGRGNGQSITGAQPPTVGLAGSSRPSALTAAERAAAAHPRSLPALLRLGQAYLDAGRLTAAHSTFQRAIKVSPAQPQAPTFDALVLAYSGHVDRALAQLTAVERRHPSFARAWLTDGLIASRRPGGRRRAERAWQHFLTLVPKGPVAADVRASLRALERSSGTNP